MEQQRQKQQQESKERVKGRKRERKWQSLDLKGVGGGHICPNTNTQPILRPLPLLFLLQLPTAVASSDRCLHPTKQ